MTDKTMPERIGAYRYDKTLQDAGLTANGTWADACNHMYREGVWAHAEYIRADLVPVPFASWEDVSRKLGLLDSLAGTVSEAIRFADKGKGPAEANISAMDMVDIEACLDELTPGWRQGEGR